MAKSRGFGTPAAGKLVLIKVTKQGEMRFLPSGLRYLQQKWGIKKVFMLLQ